MSAQNPGKLFAARHRLKGHNMCGVVRVRGRIAAIVAREPQTCCVAVVQVVALAARGLQDPEDRSLRRDARA